jgi:hypothetical protein
MVKYNKKHCTYIIRIYDQDLCIGWIDKGGYFTPQKHIDGKELLKNLKENGLKVIKFAFSSIGSCYFVEVKGTYKGSLEFSKLETKANDFNWNV